MKLRTLLLAASLGILAMQGCGGSGDSSNPPAGCGGTFSGASFSIGYPERSRLVAPSSALSGKLVITNGLPAGGDLTIDFNRNSSLAAHNETYSIPTVSTSATLGSLTLYAGAGQTGAIVGTASAAVTASCAKFQLSSFSLNNTVKHVSVQPLSLKVGAPAAQLTFTATDAASSSVVLSPGSAIFSATGTAATVSKSGLVTPVSVGTVSVTATVDGITSPSATITVSAGTTAGTSYKVVDLGTNVMQPDYASVETSQVGKRLSDSGKCVTYNLATKTFEVFNINNPAAKTTLGGSNDQSRVYAIDDSGLVLGGQFGDGAAYWTGNYSTPHIFKGTNALIATAVNSSGAEIGSGPFDGFYWSSTSATPSTLKPLNGSSLQIIPKEINKSGMIVGAAANTTGTTKYTAIVYNSPAAVPSVLASPGAGADYQATSCNASGTIVGVNYSIGYDGYLWNGPTGPAISIGSMEPFQINDAGTVVGNEIDFSDPTGFGRFAAVYTKSAGLKLLYSLCDSSRTGWNLQEAITINAGGTILGQGKLNGVVHTYAAVPLN